MSLPFLFHFKDEKTETEESNLYVEREKCASYYGKLAMT